MQRADGEHDHGRDGHGVRVHGRVPDHREQGRDAGQHDEAAGDEVPPRERLCAARAPARLRPPAPARRVPARAPRVGYGCACGSASRVYASGCDRRQRRLAAALQHRDRPGRLAGERVRLGGRARGLARVERRCAHERLGHARRHRSAAQRAPVTPSLTAAAAGTLARDDDRARRQASASIGSQPEALAHATPGRRRRRRAASAARRPARRAAGEAHVVGDAELAAHAPRARP